MDNELREMHLTSCNTVDVSSLPKDLDRSALIVADRYSSDRDYMIDKLLDSDEIHDLMAAIVDRDLKLTLELLMQLEVLAESNLKEFVRSTLESGADHD